jgi:hypothetical protein
MHALSSRRSKAYTRLRRMSPNTHWRRLLAVQAGTLCGLALANQLAYQGARYGDAGSGKEED